MRKSDSIPLLSRHLTAAVSLVATDDAFAHASEQAFVLLLPTGVYITSGVLAVALTIVLLAFLPTRTTHRLLRPIKLFSASRQTRRTGTKTTDQTDKIFTWLDTISIASFGLLVLLLWLGLVGSHDPLENPLPLFIWTLWWIGFIVIQGVWGNLWRVLNPWTGVYRLLQTTRFSPVKRGNSNLTLPKHVGVWPGVVGLIFFMLFALADIAPDAPARLALFVGSYWFFIFAGMCLFGEKWLYQADCFTILLNRYAQLALFNKTVSYELESGGTANNQVLPQSTQEPFGHNSSLTAGFPGWSALSQPAVTVSNAVFILVLLGTGSFDGFNETFYWLDLIGINPLEFPGRSAVIMQTSIGLLGSNIALIVIYALCIYLGVVLANRQQSTDLHIGFKSAFCHLAIAILPIAFAYHFAHFLTAFMVNAQYALAAASDPLDNGTDLFGLGTFYVSTGFMNSHHTVEAIWLTQAVAVVFGHVLSVLLAHALALELFGSARRAIISQVPLAAFMVVYTFIGLWLLAAPRGA